MARSLLLLCGLVLLCGCSMASATLYIVGDASGWTTPSRAGVNFSQWAAAIPFQVGDSLEFDYVAKAHSVLEVTRSNFRYCNTTSPFASYDDGKTIIVLSKQSSYYFIDGVGDHCKEGQKFQVKVTKGAASTVASSPAAGFEPLMAPAPEPSTQAAMPPLTAAASVLQTSVAMVAGLVFWAAAMSKLM